MRVRRLAVVDAGQQLVERVRRDDVLGLAAELAYRFFLSLFPVLIFVAALGGFVADLLAIRNPTQQIIDLLGAILPPEATRLVRPEIEQLVGEEHPGLLSSGVLGSIWAATGGTNATIKAMNRAYQVPETRPFWKRYLLAIGLTLLAGSLLVVAFGAFVALQAFGEEVAVAFGLGERLEHLLEIASWPAVFLLLLAATALLYAAAPNTDLPARWVSPGAVLFAGGWLLVTYGLGQYVENFGTYEATYGALGGVVVLLVWFYLVAFILLVGGELNALVAERPTPRSSGEDRQPPPAFRQPAPGTSGR
jgi:membrane protein